MPIARLAYAQWGDGHARFHAQFRLHRAWHSNRMHAFGGGAGFPQTPLTELLRQARHPFELQDQPQGGHSIFDVAAAGRKLALRARYAQTWQGTCTFQRTTGAVGARAAPVGRSFQRATTAPIQQWGD
jgi:hypothetical protein